MRPVTWLVLSVGVLLALASTVQASTITVDYSTISPAGYQSSNTTTLGGITAEGFTVAQTGSPTDVLPTLGNVSTLAAANLYVRTTSPDDLGLGVCSEGQTACDQGGGDVNELENNGSMELLRLTRPITANWLSISFSSLDNNGSSPLERGLLYQNSTNDPGTATLVGPFQAPNEGPFAISGLQQYLFLVAWDFTGAGNVNNDYLLKEVIYDDTGRGDVPAVPEPATLTLLGLGLSTAGVLRRRRASKR